MTLFNKDFLIACLERAGKTVVQTLVATITVSGVSALFGATWKDTLLTALAAGVVSLLMSLGSVAVGPPGAPPSPSLVNEGQTPPSPATES